MTKDVRDRPEPWDLAELPKPSRNSAELKSDLEIYGYCIVEQALSSGDLAAVQERIAAQAAAERKLHSIKNPANTDSVNQWVGMLLNKGDVFFRLIEDELCFSLIAHLIGEDYMVSCVDAQIQHPGASTMPLHTDQWWMPSPQRVNIPPKRPAEAQRNCGQGLDPKPSDGLIAPIAAANVMWAITDFTEDNGATRLVPRSHLSGQQPDPSVPHKVPSVAAATPAGGAIVFDARLWHGAGANRTDSPRYGITTVGCGPQFRPLENYVRGLRPEVLARCSPETLRRIGFSTWGGYNHTGDPGSKLIAEGTKTLGELRP
jgi:ectoine hydroxylase-related dioxygenase (phytanoyl-CoA dioxygenase family)